MGNVSNGSVICNVTIGINEETDSTSLTLAIKEPAFDAAEKDRLERRMVLWQSLKLILVPLGPTDDRFNVLYPPHPLQSTHYSYIIRESEHRQRVTGDYVNVGKEKGTFDVAQRTFSQQFSQIYYIRLATLAPLLRAQAQSKWTHLNRSHGLYNINLIGVASVKPRILDVEAGRLSSVIGTVYVEMEYKPNILKDLATDVLLLTSSHAPSSLVANREAGAKGKIHWREMPVFPGRRHGPDRDQL